MLLSDKTALELFYRAVTRLTAVSYGQLTKVIKSFTQTEKKISAMKSHSL